MPIHASGIMRNANPQVQQAMMQQQQMQPQQKGWLDSIKELLFGQQPGWTQLENFNPDQMSALQQLLQGGLGQLQNPTAGFQPISDEAMRQFHQQIVPSLLERFTAGGGYGSNALSSPGLASQLSSGGAGLASMLAAQKANYGLESQGLGLKQTALGLQNPYQYASTPGTGGLVGGGIDLLKGVGSPILQQSFATGSSIPSIIKKTIWG